MILDATWTINPHLRCFVCQTRPSSGITAASFSAQSCFWYRPERHLQENSQVTSHLLSLESIVHKYCWILCGCAEFSDWVHEKGPPMSIDWGLQVFNTKIVFAKKRNHWLYTFNWWTTQILQNSFSTISTGGYQNVTDSVGNRNDHFKRKQKLGFLVFSRETNIFKHFNKISTLHSAIHPLFPEVIPALEFETKSPCFSESSGIHYSDFVSVLPWQDSGRAADEAVLSLSERDLQELNYITGWFDLSGDAEKSPIVGVQQSLKPVRAEDTAYMLSSFGASMHAQKSSHQLKCMPRESKFSGSYEIGSSVDERKQKGICSRSRSHRFALSK